MTSQRVYSTIKYLASEFIDFWCSAGGGSGVRKKALTLQRHPENKKFWERHPIRVPKAVMPIGYKQLKNGF